ncbi:MAG: tetratricopeptide repeat protein [Candidatus Magasanikbacteria bacterium]|nr:tetratricopeptide repeat protein [Candidatus Magasanikbacteria bacterium]
MFYSFFPIVLIFISLAAIVIVVARKFPQMTGLDTEKLPEVKQAKIKEEIQFQKFLRHLAGVGVKLKSWSRYLGFFKNGWLLTQGRFRMAVHNLQEKYKKSVIAEFRKEVKESAAETKSKKGAAKKKTTIAPVTSLDVDHLKHAEKSREAGDLPLAERLFIEVIKSNPREAEAYRGLGKTYLAMEKLKEAKETFEFLAKLKPDEDRVYNYLGMVAEAQGKKAEAIRYFEEAVRLNDKLAVRFYDLGRIYASAKRPAAALRNFARAAEIEPNNPKYLDQLLEMSIITGDVDLAQEVYDRFRLTNPDNQKLPEFKQRIEEMEE